MLRIDKFKNEFNLGVYKYENNIEYVSFLNVYFLL